MSNNETAMRATELFTQHEKGIHVRTDKLFGKLFLLQYFAGIAAAIFISPRTWIGDQSAIHVHVYAAVILGALIFGFPLALIRYMPGHRITRHAVAVAQMLFSGLLIHLTGGRIETHFHIFGSLAFLSFYRDWRVLVSASVVVAFDHLFRGVFWPTSVFGVLAAESWRWIEHTAWVIFEDVFLVLAISQSIQEMRSTAERQADAEEKKKSLQKSEAEYRAIFDLAGSGKIEIDRQTLRIVRANRKLSAMTGYSHDELVSMKLTDLTWPADLVEDLARLERITSGQLAEFQHEKKYKTKDGKCLWVLVTGATINDESGQPDRIIATVQDISKHKRTEASLADASRRAEEANQAKSAFIANMSHEIRTPLGAMLGFAELMLEEQTLTPEHQGHLTTILRNGDQLYRIINEVLDLSKVEANKFEIDKSKFDLDEVIRDVTSLLAIKAHEKGLLFEVASEGPLPDSIVSDSTRFRQILMNVIGNAIKFTEKGRVGVTFRIKEQSSPEKSARLEVIVEDTGVGISIEQQERLFKPFSQADSTTTRKFGGTGLGLYLSKRLAQALGGDLVLENCGKGKGCTFLISIDAGPLEKKPILNIHAGTSEHVVKGDFRRTVAESLEGVRVLVVDDSPDNLQLTYRFLSAANAVVDCAGSALEGIDRLKDAHYDVVVMDIQMPGMDGYEAVRQLRNDGYAKPVLALTAHAMKGERERCIEAGFDGYLVKPINRAILIKTVKSYSKGSLGVTKSADIIHSYATTDPVRH